MLARRLQLEQADAAAKAALADSMAARDEQQRTRDDLRSKLAEPSLNQAASLKEKIPTVETRKRVATTQLEQLEEEWARVDAEAKKKYQTVEKAIEDHLKVLAWCAHRLAHRAHTVCPLSPLAFFPAGRRARYGWCSTRMRWAWIGNRSRLRPTESLGSSSMISTKAAKQIARAPGCAKA